MWMQNFSWSCVVTHRPKNPATPPRGNLYFGHIHKLTHQSQMFTTRNSAENFTKKKKVLDRQTRFGVQTDPVEKIQSFNWLDKQNSKRASKQIKSTLRRTTNNVLWIQTSDTPKKTTQIYILISDYPSLRVLVSEYLDLLYCIYLISTTY